MQRYQDMIVSNQAERGSNMHKPNKVQTLTPSRRRTHTRGASSPLLHTCLRPLLETIDA